jgi:SAM-dependent methyltransferase
MLRRVARRLLRPFRAPPPPSAPQRQPQPAPVPTGPILLTSLIPLRATPSLGGRDEFALRDLLRSLEIEAAPRAEMQGYVDADYRRFLHTAGLVPDGTGKLLEIGANPYYTTLLLKLFTRYELSLTNYFVDSDPGRTQPGTYDDAGVPHQVGFTYVPVNVERDRFPFADATFEVALFCEVIEHMQMDPLHALAELNRVLKPGGTLVLTTPNAARLENVSAMLAGTNVYDQYSKYGPYGRHNREYVRDEMKTLLDHAGFTVEESFTADVHDAVLHGAPDLLARVAAERVGELGQYMFFRARKRAELPAGGLRKPSFLYRSYDADQMA